MKIWKWFFSVLLAVSLIVNGVLIAVCCLEKLPPYSFFPIIHHSLIFEVKEDIILYQDSGEKIGILYKGAKLMYDGGTDEGFERAVLYMNYYDKPDHEKYYDLHSTKSYNLIIPAWNDRDVTPIDK